jgi:micrococcal nuclease
MLNTIAWWRSLQLLFVVFLFSYVTCNAAEHFSAKVIKVIDGDSLIVESGSEEIKIRLWGIDSPEWNQPYAKQAKKTVKKMLDGKTVTVIPKDIDRFGRLVALVSDKKNYINEFLIAKGSAWVHVYYCDEEICKKWQQLEKEAQKKKVGLWRSQRVIPPWKWKRGKR